MEKIFARDIGVTYLKWLPLKEDISRGMITKYIQYRKAANAKRN
jgi:hypothetical protein